MFRRLLGFAFLAIGCAQTPADIRAPRTTPLPASSPPAPPRNDTDALGVSSAMDGIVSAVIRPLVETGARAAGVIVVDGARSWIRTWGDAQSEPRMRFTEDTRFEIGSVSKVFAGLMFADAVQRGEVGWADLLSRRLTSVHVAEYKPRHRIDADGTRWATLGWEAHPRDGVLWKNGLVQGQRSVMAVLPSRHQGLFIVINDARADVDTAGATLLTSLFRPTPAVDGSHHAQFVVESIPRESTTADVTFADAIRVVAWTAPAHLRVGETGHVRLFFQSIAAADRDWKIFVHADAASGSARRIGIDHYPGGGADSTRFWKPGEIIVDDFDVIVPTDVTPAAFDVWFGLYSWNSRAPAAAHAAEEVRENRVRGPRIAIDPAPREKRR